MSQYNNNSTTGANKSQFVRTAQGINMSYTGARPAEGDTIQLALVVDAEGNTTKSLNNDGIETVSFRNSFELGDLYCYVPVTEVGKAKKVQLMVDKAGVKYATFTVQNSIAIQTTGSKPASL